MREVRNGARVYGWVLLLAAASAPVFAQEPLATVVERAARYVDAYQRDLALIVSEEKYEQEARYPAAPGTRGRDLSTRTTLRSDFLLVRIPDGGWLPFRDVFERDGRALRDRDERLTKLFLDASANAMEQARRIVDEGARYNVGTLNRNINLPTLALIFLTDAYRPRFEFEDRGTDDGARVVQFREVGRPTYTTTTGGRDLPVSGRYWIDAASGRVVRTQLTAGDTELEARIDVSYRFDDTAALWVPVKMEELYRQRSDRSEITGVATYSRFRRFSVSTTEAVVP